MGVGALGGESEVELRAHVGHRHFLGGHHLLFDLEVAPAIRTSCFGPAPCAISTCSRAISIFTWMSGLIWKSKSSEKTFTGGAGGTGGIGAMGAAAGAGGAGAAGVWSHASADILTGIGGVGGRGAIGAAAGRGGAGESVPRRRAAAEPGRPWASEAARRQEAPWRAGRKSVSVFESDSLFFSFKVSGGASARPELPGSGRWSPARES